MTKSPLVSVLMPVKGPSPYLQDAINSILQQTLSDLELLLVGYPDDTRWMSSIPGDPRIQCLTRDSDGIVAALNTGLRHARGQYVARMDADDVAYTNRLEEQIKLLSTEPDVHLAAAKVRLFNEVGTIEGGNQHYQQWLNNCRSPDEIRQNIFVESPLPHPTWCAGKHVFDTLQGYRNTPWPEDYDFILRAHLAGLGMAKPDTLLMDWRDHPNRLTRQDSRYSREAFTQAKAWALAQSVAKDRNVIVCGTGRNATRLHDALQHEGIKTLAFVERDNARTRTSRRHLPVITYQTLLADKPNALVVSAVTAWGAGAELRNLFTRQGWVEFDDFIIAG